MPDLATFAKVDYLAEMLRWWDRWLKGEPNGIDDEPPVTIYVQGVGWRCEREWPIARTEERRDYLVQEPPGVGGWPMRLRQPRVRSPTGLTRPLA